MAEISAVKEERITSDNSPSQTLERDPMMVLVRAMARAEARRLFGQPHEEGHVSLLVSLCLPILIVLLLFAAQVVFK